METNILLKNTNIDLRPDENAAITLWEGSKIIARLEIENGKISLSTPRA